MVKVVAILLCGLVGAVAYAAAPKSSQSTKSSKIKPVKASSKKSSSKGKKAAAPPRQNQPSSGRYREIQEALISKGFLEGPSTGQWDSKSIDAFKRFERSQNLTEDGKLDSLALIALGLGPQRAESVPQTDVP